MYVYKYILYDYTITEPARLKTASPASSGQFRSELLPMTMSEQNRKE